VGVAERDFGVPPYFLNWRDAAMICLDLSIRLTRESAASLDNDDCPSSFGVLSAATLLSRGVSRPNLSGECKCGIGDGDGNGDERFSRLVAVIAIRGGVFSSRLVTICT